MEPRKGKREGRISRWWWWWWVAQSGRAGEEGLVRQDWVRCSIASLVFVGRVGAGRGWRGGRPGAGWLATGAAAAVPTAHQTPVRVRYTRRECVEIIKSCCIDEESFCIDVTRSIDVRNRCIDIEELLYRRNELYRRRKLLYKG